MHETIIWRSRKERADFFPYISKNSFWDGVGKIRETAERCTTKLSRSRNKWCWGKKKKCFQKEDKYYLTKKKNRRYDNKTYSDASSVSCCEAGSSVYDHHGGTSVTSPHPRAPSSPTLPTGVHGGKQRKPSQHWHWLAESRSISQSCPWCLISTSRKSSCLNYRSKFILNSINSYGKHMGLKSLTSHYLGLIDTALGGLP